MRPRGRLKIFGIDDTLVGLLGAGAMNFFGAQQSNTANAEINAANNLFNAQQAGAQRQFSWDAMKDQQFYNHQQAVNAMNFASGEAHKLRDFNASEAANARTFSSSEAQKARDYTTMMSNSAYQRQVADMKAAGLNPIMAAMQGGGASTPQSPSPQGAQASGSLPSSSQGTSGMASGSAAHSGPPVAMRNVMENVFNSALDLARMDPTVKGLQQDVKTKAEDTLLRTAQQQQTKSATAVNNATAKNVEADTEKKHAETENVKRAQSQVNVFGTGANPAYYADKAAGVFGSAKQWMTTNAKSLWKMINGE